jgi:hypothetical protein
MISSGSCSGGTWDRLDEDDGARGAAMSAYQRRLRSRGGSAVLWFYVLSASLARGPEGMGVRCIILSCG